MERRRIAGEAYAFFEMVDSAMLAVLDDVVVARTMATGIQEDGWRTSQAYAVRQRIKKAGFSELRSACLSQGDQIVTLALMRLDKEIDDFASQVSTTAPIPVGEHKGLHEQLEGVMYFCAGRS